MTIPPDHTAPFIDLLLSVADDKLVLGHRNSDWTGLAPILEEDIAFSALAQDEIAHAQALYEIIGALDGRAPDQIAFGRTPEAYRCATLVEPGDAFDWARALVRQFFCDHFDRLRLARLARSSHAPTAALCARIAAEERLHVEHVDGWIRRLGIGTDESRTRVQVALDALAPAAAMLAEPVEGQAELEASGLYPPGEHELFDAWTTGLARALDDTGLRLALERPAPGERGGRHGVHTPALAELLDEMCEVFRIEPEAAW